MCKFIQDIKAKTQTQTGAIQVLDEDERRVEAKLREAADRMDMNMWVWSTSKGLQLLQPEPAGNKGEAFQGEPVSQPDVASPSTLFTKLLDWKAGPSIVLAKDVNSLMNRATTAPMIARQLKNLNAAMLGQGEDPKVVQLVVLDAEESQFPCGYQKADLPLPNRKEMEIILTEILESVCYDDEGNKLEEDPPSVKEVVESDELRERLLNAISGLPAFQASNALAESLSRTDRFDPKQVAEYKKQMVSAKGMEIIDPDPRALEAIGGMDALKAYFRECLPSFNETLAVEYDLDPPKGIIISGLPGGGKSALAKALAAYFGFTLVRIDFGTARGMFQGQSEEGIKNILKTLEAISPCIAWVDEVEKNLSGAGQGGATDGGTGDRMFGQVLTFMQECPKVVFWFLTANRPEQLPPEFTRVGRIDKTWWVDVPSISARRSIVDVFCKKYRKTANIDREALVVASDGFMGAEIEGAMKAALRVALAERAEEVSTEMVLEKLKNMPQVSKSFEMPAERQTWANNAEQADAPETETNKPKARRRMRRSPLN